MWYVVQTQTGNEHMVMELLEKLAQPGVINNVFMPAFEDVRKKDGVAHISLRRLFPGYFFVDTKDPEIVFDTLKQIPEFARLLGAEENDGIKLFLPVEPNDEEFLDSLMMNGVMKVSYIKRSKNGRIEHIIGPLSKYINKVIKFDISRRRAIVQAEIFGKERKLKFGLWTEEDPKLPWISDILNKGQRVERKIFLRDMVDLDIRSGDKVTDKSGIYENLVFVVDSVDVEKRVINTTINMFGTGIKIQLNADDIKKV